jgi:hypothetical protein
MFMAGRQISVTDQALGTVRVMKTIGMMGEVVGKAAAVAIKNNCTPREVYQNHWYQLDELLKLPGRARRATLNDAFDISGPAPGPVDDTGGRGGSTGGTGVQLTSLKGLALDNKEAKLTGKWAEGAGLEHVGPNYAYASAKSGAKAVWEFSVPADGRYEVRFATAPHENRSPATPVTIISGDGSKTVKVNQKTATGLWVSLGTFNFSAAKKGVIEVSTEGTTGNVHIDAINILKAE